MKKGHVSSLLTDYIDGLLSPDEASAVKKHLAGCAECRDEHRFLKRYLSKAAAFPRVPVPDDFLDNIHARIGAPERSGIVRTLFFPLKVKLPLEAAAALVVAVLGVLVFRPFGDRGIEYHAGAPVSEEVTAPSSGRQAEGSLAQDAGKARKEAGARYRQKVPGVTGKITVTNGADSAKIASAEETADREAPVEIALVLKSAGSESNASGTLALKDLRQKETVAGQGEKASSDYTKSVDLSAKNQTRVDLIVNLASVLGGRAVSVGEADASGYRRLLIVEIPAKNYAQFMTGLKGSWSVQKQAPSAPPSATGRLRLTMSLQD
jgi:hypothetical protein